MVDVVAPDFNEIAMAFGLTGLSLVGKSLLCISSTDISGTEGRAGPMDGCPVFHLCSLHDKSHVEPHVFSCRSVQLILGFIYPCIHRIVRVFRIVFVSHVP